MIAITVVAAPPWVILNPNFRSAISASRTRIDRCLLAADTLGSYFHAGAIRDNEGSLEAG